MNNCRHCVLAMYFVHCKRPQNEKAFAFSVLSFLSFFCCLFWRGSGVCGGIVVVWRIHQVEYFRLCVAKASVVACDCEHRVYLFFCARTHHRPMPNAHKFSIFLRANIEIGCVRLGVCARATDSERFSLSRLNRRPFHSEFLRFPCRAAFWRRRRQWRESKIFVRCSASTASEWSSRSGITEIRNVNYNCQNNS